MASSPDSTLIGVRLQGLGDNTNTWGDDKLNNVLTVLAKSAHGYEAIALTGDVTISETNYATDNETENAIIKFTGSLSAAATVTLPGRERLLLFHNAAGQNVTVKCSGGTGVTIPTGFMALAYCDSTDFFSVGQFVNGAITASGDITVNGQVKTLTDGTADQDAVSKLQMETYINAVVAAASSDSGVVKVDAAATAGYLISVLTGSTDVTLTDNGNTLDIGVNTVGREKQLGITMSLATSMA